MDDELNGDIVVFIAEAVAPLATRFVVTKELQVIVIAKLTTITFVFICKPLILLKNPIQLYRNTSSDHQNQAMIGLIRAYRRLLHQRPFITNVATTCTFMVTGDLTSQIFFQNKGQIDFNQTLRFGLAGIIFIGPAVRGCLVMIDKIFGPTTSIKVLAKKLLFDQGICAPCFLVGNISTLTFLQYRTFDSIKIGLEENYLNILKMNYSFWPFVQVVNFYFIPLTYRVLFGSSAALAWNTILSYKLFNEQNTPTTISNLTME